MKYISCVILCIFALFCCSNNKTTVIENNNLDTISHSVLEDWLEYYKIGDSTFNLANFEVIYSDLNISLDDMNAYKPDNFDLFIYSPDSNFYIDLDYYNIIEDGEYQGSDIDSKVVLYDKRKQKESDIIVTGSSEWFDDAFWLNDSMFVLLENAIYWDENQIEGNYLLPYISIWNTEEKTLAKYKYNGKIKRPKGLYLYKRLQRSGIKINE
jgi:hypothetical protein